MRITSIRTHQLLYRLSEPFGFSQWSYDTRRALLVEVIADDGTIGWGECYGPADVTQAAVTGFYGPRLLGLDPLKTDLVWHAMWQASLDFARRGVMMGAMSGLDEKLDLALAAGECEQTRWGFQSLLAPGGVQVAQPDLAYCGGPSEGLKIRAIASSLGVNVIPHAWGTMLNLAAALHLLASSFREPGRAEVTGPVLEYDRTPNPLRDELFEVPLEISDGMALVPTAPGLGVVPDRAAIERFRVQEAEVK